MDKLKVIYDLKSIPEGLTLDQVFNIMNNGGIIVWDSTLKGVEPKVIESSELEIYDVGFLPKEEFDERLGNLKEE